VASERLERGGVDSLCYWSICYSGAHVNIATALDSRPGNKTSGVPSPRGG